jgi:hypothetical protein
MTALTDRTLPLVVDPMDLAPSDDPEALLKEAPRRRRRRNLLRGAAAILLFGIVGLWVATRGGGGGEPGSHSPVITHPKTGNSVTLTSCNASQLVATVGAGQGGPVQDLGGTLLTIANPTGAACEIQTFPKLQLVGSADVVATAPPPGEVHVDLDMRPGPSGAKVANLYWQNWCGNDPRPLTLRVILANGRGTITAPFGSSSSPLPGCTNRSDPTTFIETGGLDTGSLFGTGRG